MYLMIFFVLLVIWLLGWAAFHIAGAAIHLLLVLAVASMIMHLIRGRSAL